MSTQMSLIANGSLKATATTLRRVDYAIKTTINNAPLKEMRVALGIDVKGINAPRYKCDYAVRLLQVIKHSNFEKVVNYHIRLEKIRQNKLTSETSED